MTDVTAETLYCANHPQTPTQLRCNKCGKPVCSRCIVRTPVGYRCKDCLRMQQQVFETALWYDYVIAGVIAAPLAGLACFFASFAQFFVILLAPVAGGVIAEIVRAAVRRRRGRYLTLVTAGAFVVGCAPLIALPLLGGLLAAFTGQGGGFLLGVLWSALWPLVFCVLGAGTVYARLRGISV
jgi:hypothetical protein